MSKVKDGVKRWLQENAESGVAYVYDDSPLFPYIKEHQKQVSYSLAVDIYYHKDKNYFEVLLH